MEKRNWRYVAGVERKSQMTETPECPYCGAEMERITGRYLDGQYKSKYCCPKCGACAPSGAFCGRAEDAQASALAYALRRAEPENRVMTLEELAGMANKGEWELAWMECRNIKSEKYFLTQKLPGIAGEHGVWFVTPGKADDIFYAANSYNKTWRCWLRKPTAEESEREKWND